MSAADLQAKMIGKNSRPTSKYSPCHGKRGSITVMKDQKLSTPFGQNMAHVNAKAADTSRPSCPLRLSPSRHLQLMLGSTRSVTPAERLSTWSDTRHGWPRTRP